MNNVNMKEVSLSNIARLNMYFRNIDYKTINMYFLYNNRCTINRGYVDYK